MTPPTIDRQVRHEGLFTDADGRHRPQLASWLRSAAERSNKVITIAAPPTPDGEWPPSADVPVATLTADGGGPAAVLDGHLQRALGEGFRGLGVVIWANGVVGATSARFHAVLEKALDDLCRHGSGSALCLYQRASVDLLGFAVGQHPDGMHDDLLTARWRDGALQLAGEIDGSNSAFLSAAMDTARPVGLDLTDVTFLGAGAAHRIVRYVAERNGAAEVSGARPHVRRVLQLVGGLTG